MQEAKGHGSALIKSTIGQHPLATAAVMGVLMLLILILLFYVVKYKNKTPAPPAKFQPGAVRSYSNFSTGSNNPEWYLGNEDAGNWGPMHREETPAQKAVYDPRLRQTNAVESEFVRQYQCQASQCQAPQYQGEQRLTTTPPSAAPTPVKPVIDSCGLGWSPAASAEVHALASVGALESNTYDGEYNIRRELNFVDSNNISDSQLEDVMHGNRPL